MALTDTAVKNAKPKEKPYKLGDSGGLFLLVQPSGGKLWRLKYRIDGKEQKLGLGTYPSFEKKRAQVSAANKFGDIAREYIEKRKKEGWAEATVAKAEWLLEHFAGHLSRYPALGHHGASCRR